MLKTKCILSPIEKDDGERISIMSRHKLDDGVTEDKRIKREMYDSHEIVFAPPLKLIGNYLRKEISWAEYERKYFEYLNKINSHIQTLVNKGLENNVTILCIEEKPDECHRKLLAQRCKDINP